MYEMMQAIQKLKSRSPGSDDIENVFLKHLTEPYFNHLLNFFNDSYTKEEFPKQLKEALLIPILKPGKPSNWFQKKKEHK